MFLVIPEGPGAFSLKSLTTSSTKSSVISLVYLHILFFLLVLIFLYFPLFSFPPLFIPMYWGEGVWVHFFGGVRGLRDRIIIFT